MPPRKVLICGATGFIGRNLTETLSRRSDLEIHAVRFTRPAYACPGVTWHQADLRQADAASQLLANMDVVIQAAATTSGANDIVNRPYIHITDNAVMNSYLLRSAFERKVGHFIFFSCSVMHQSNDRALREEDFNANAEMHPRYFGIAWTKVYVEKMCEFYARLGGTRFTAIRHSNVYGPHDKFDLERSHVLGATVTKVLTANDDKITIWGTGEEARDLLYVDDLVTFVERAIEHQSRPFGLYNVGYGEAIAVVELVRKIVAASGLRLRIEHDLDRPTIRTSLFLDCSRAARELGWHRRISLDDGIKRTIEWWRANLGRPA